MAKLTAEDIRDELLGPLVATEDLSETDEYLEALAAERGVTLVETLPFKVKRLAIAYCCTRICTRKSGVNPRNYQGTDGADAYELKRRVYAAQVRELEPQMSEALLSGETPEAANDGEIRLWRA